jgi:hypothetical protein
MRGKKEQRGLHLIVWAGRISGSVLVALAIFNASQIGPLTWLDGGFRVLISAVLGALGIAWVVGLELVLRFFDRYLSRN